jgi:hypothetical protein
MGDDFDEAIEEAGSDMTEPDAPDPV